MNLSAKTARWVFWGGTLASIAVFGVLTVDTHRQLDALTHADRLSEQVVDGKRAFERHNCNDCHTILGFGAYYAPDLTRAHSRIGSNAIVRRLREPHVVFAASYRKMPRQPVTPEEGTAIAAYLEWVDGIENNDWPPQDSKDRWSRSTERLLASSTLSPGAALVQQEGCLECHALGRAGTALGPRLEWIGQRHDANWIADYIANPEALSPGSEMPASDNLSPAQRGQIAAFLVSAGAEGGRP